MDQHTYAKMDLQLLEDWLCKMSSPSTSTAKLSPPSSIPSAQEVAHAWALLRACVQSGSLEPEHVAALKFLESHGRTLHLGEKQARVLISMLSSVFAVDEGALGRARRSAALLLSIWLRKDVKLSEGGKSNSSSPAYLYELLPSLVNSAMTALESSGSKHVFVNEAILLLGSACAVPHIREDLRKVCLEAITRECYKEKTAIVNGSLKQGFAGLGLAIVSAGGDEYTGSLVRAILLLWSGTGAEDAPAEDETLKILCSEGGLALLHLMEWCSSMFVSQTQFQGLTSAKLMVQELLQASTNDTSLSGKCATVLSAAGFLRNFYHQSLEGPKNVVANSSWQSLANSLESMFIYMVDVSLQTQIQMLEGSFEAAFCTYAYALENCDFCPPLLMTEKYWFWCVCLCLSRCIGFPSRPSLLLCLASVLIEDVLPLASFYNDWQRFWSSLQHRQTESQVSVATPHLSTHVESHLFHEAGALSRAICEQYRLAEKKWQLWIENLLWQFACATYRNHRYFVVAYSSVFASSGNASLEKAALDKVLVAVIFSTVMIFSSAMKAKEVTDAGVKGQFATQVLCSFSMLEFIRQGHVPEYRELVQKCVSCVSSSEVACHELALMFPQYDEVFQPLGVCIAGPHLSDYDWKQDTVQNMRILFGFRVLPSCLDKFPLPSFSNRVALLLLLYLQHPIDNLVQASHSLFAAFISCKGGDFEQSCSSSDSDGDSAKEQLAEAYIRRVLEGVLRASNIDSLVVGVGTIVHHLPAGSSTTMRCISHLARKVNDMFQCVPSMLKFEELKVPQPRGVEIEIAKKLQTLLLHLILVVDIQVLPHLLQEVARVILGLPSQYQTDAVEEAFDVLAGCEDLTRKYVLVPWLQSLSYLCSHPDREGRFDYFSKQNAQSGSVAHQQDGMINLNPTNAYDNEGVASWPFTCDVLPYLLQSRL